MEKRRLESKVKSSPILKSENEIAYLSAIMPEARQEGYTCVTGCSECVSCGGNDSTNYQFN